MKLFYCSDFDQMSKKAASVVASQVITKPDSILGLATGSSPLGIYRELIERYNRGEMSFKNVTTVNLDEYCGLSPDTPQSYHYFMHRNFFDYVDICHDNIHIPNGLNEDARAETARYDALLNKLGGIDLQLLGIGIDGHIGFNEPSDYFPKGTIHIELDESTIEMNSRFFQSIDEVPRYAYSMGCREIIDAKQIIFIASGKSKAEIIEKAFFGDITPKVPASLLQIVSDKVLAFCDRDALSVVIENHPEAVIGL